MNRAKCGFLGLMTGILCAAPAGADVTGFLGDLVAGKSAAADFIGVWNGPAGGDIDHIVVTASSSGPVRIQVFGRCEARVCNWGALPARARTDAPNSESVRSLSADFNLGFALRHITLHRLPGNQLRFDMATEFTDGSDRHDYETAGQLSPMGAAAAAAPPPAPPSASPAAPPPSAPGSTPIASAAPSTTSSISLNPLRWFSSKPAEQAAPQPAAQAGPVPIDNSVPLAVSTAPPVDDCFSFDTGHVYLAPNNATWNLRDFLHVVQGFGPYRGAANTGLTVVKFYRFDEVCHIGRGSTNMVFFRAAGEIPHTPMGGGDCTDVHPDQIAAAKRDDDWKVVDGNREIFSYGSDQEGAAQAASVIKSLNLSRQCFYDRANLAASYWLSR